MKDHSDCHRAFTWTDKAYYAETIVRESHIKSEIMFGMYDTENGTTGEMLMRWVWLGSSKLAPQLTVFDDAWSVLSLFSDVLKQLAEVDDENISPEQFIEILLLCGFIDETSYENPYERKLTPLQQELVDNLMAVADPLPFKQATLIDTGEKVFVVRFVSQSETDLPDDRWQKGKYVWIIPMVIPFGQSSHHQLAGIVGEGLVELHLTSDS